MRGSEPYAVPRFHRPLIEPDVRSYRIRLSDQASRRRAREVKGSPLESKDDTFPRQVPARSARPGELVQPPDVLSVCEGMSLVFREPDAGKRPAGFDERRVDTEHGEASEAPADERAGN